MNNNGFTLIELLIAMSLTSVIGMVLFSTYDMVMQFGNESKKIVFQKEQERLFSTILDNDFANISIVHNKPIPVFLTPQEHSARFKQFAGDEKDTSGSDILVISLQTTFQIHGGGTKNALPPACAVEYYLQKSRQNSYALIRRERPFAGIDTDFQTSELLLDKNIKEIDIQALWNEQYYSNWSEKITADKNFYPQAFKFTVSYSDKKNFTFIVPVPAKEREKR